MRKIVCFQADTEAVGELDQPAGISVAPTARLHFLTRRAQTLVLIQLTACFSESRAHMLAAKLSHGAMIVVSKELLQEAKGLLSISGIMPWSQWVAREEAIRTLWATCEFRAGRHPLRYHSLNPFSRIQISSIAFKRSVSQSIPAFCART